MTPERLHVYKTHDTMYLSFYCNTPNTTVHPTYLTMKPTTRNPRLDQRFTLIDTERRFRRACEQIVQLNYKLDDLQGRYLSAKKDNLRSFRYNCRLRLAVVEGLRNMYYDYAHQKAEDIAGLRKDLYGETVEIVASDEDSDEDDDMMD